MAGHPTWFEIGVGDVERGRAFYGTLLDWELTPFGGGYVIATDGGKGAGGGIHGNDAGATAMAFFAVDDLDATLARLTTLGGEQVMIHEDGDGSASAHLGRFAICKDDQGSFFGVHQPPG